MPSGRVGSGTAGKLPKERKKQMLVERAQADFAAWLEEAGIQKEKQLAAAHPLKRVPEHR